MPAVLVTPVVISSTTGTLVASLTTGLLIGLTIVPISVTNAQENVATKTSNTTKVSEIERRQYLDYLQSETSKSMILATIFLIILAVGGFFGNSLIIIVYTRKHHRSATEFLIVTLAIVDLIANTAAIPAEIYSMFHKWDFDNPNLCRATRYMASFLTLTSGLILVVVAVTRYRKVCHPYKWQMTDTIAKVITTVIFFLVALFCIPYTIIIGRQTKRTPRSDIVAYACTVDDVYVNTIYPLIMYVFFLLLYLVCSVTLTVVYILIGVKALGHRPIRGRSLPGTSVRCSDHCPTPMSSVKITSAAEPSYNENESNCTMCGSSYKRDIDRPLTSMAVFASSNRVHNIETKRCYVDIEGNETSVQCDVRVFTNCIPVVDGVLVRLQKPLSVTDPAILEKNTYDSTDNRNKIQTDHCSGDYMSTSCSRMIEISVSKGVMRRVKFNLGDSESNVQYFERFAGFLNIESKLKTTGANNETGVTVEMFSSKKRSHGNDSKWDTTALSLLRAEKGTQFPTSIETAKFDVIDQSDPLLRFKWLDIIYCPGREHRKRCTNCAHRNAKLFFRLCLNSVLLQPIERLETGVMEAMEGENEVTERSSAENLPVPNSLKDNNVNPLATLVIRDETSTTTAVNCLQKKPPNRDKMIRRVVEFSNVQQEPTSKKRIVRRTTVMLVIISALFIFGYLPHLTLMFTKLLAPHVIDNMSLAQLTFYNLFLRSYYLNTAANPVIYGLCDINFRQACFRVIKL